MPEREVYWNIPYHQIMYLLLLIALVIFFFSMCRHLSALLKSKKDQVSLPALTERLKIFWREVLAQKRIRRDRTAGSRHLFLFLGFLILFIGTLIVALQADFGIKVLIGKFYLGFSLILDIAGFVALVGVAGLAYRRYALRPSVLSQSADDTVLLGLITLILISGFMIEGLRKAAIHDPWAVWSPVGWVLSLIFAATDINLLSLHRVLWWSHLGLTMIFIAYLPYSKARHLLFAPINLWITGNQKNGAVLPLDITASNKVFGAVTLEGFTRKQVLETFSCTRCGRCEQGCPAFLTHKPLSPRELNLGLRDFFMCMPKNGEQMLAPGLLDPETIWACTTCGYCENVCPVLIRQVGRTVEIRRGLVLEQGKVPEELKPVLRNMEKQGNPWGEWRGSRGGWAQNLGVPQLKDKGSSEVLFWVGCFGSFDERAKQISKAILKILKTAEIDYAILGGEERCCGDAARRSGEEYLFQELARDNIGLLESHGVKRIITGCPHCYNVLNNDYRTLGAVFDVQHTSEFIAELLREGKLKLNEMVNQTVTYHDPCYLGRYNEVYDAPRQVLAGITGINLIEMERNRENSFCCGAGGGHMWMDEGVGERINHVRTQEALTTGAETIVTACPFCLTMYEDGTSSQAKSPEKSVEVIDLAELVAKVI